MINKLQMASLATVKTSDGLEHNVGRLMSARNDRCSALVYIKISQHILHLHPQSSLVPIRLSAEDILPRFDH